MKEEKGEAGVAVAGQIFDVLRPLVEGILVNQARVADALESIAKSQECRVELERLIDDIA